MVEKVRVAIATGEASKECWYLLTSLPPHRCSPGEMLRLFRSHWSIENNLHHVKDRSWDEDRHTLRRPGLGEVFATLVNVSLNTLRLACVWLAFGLRLACVWLAFLEGWFPSGMWLACRCEPSLPVACVWLAFGLRLACVWLAFGLRLACVWKDGFLPECPCRCEPRPVPSARNRLSPGSSDMQPDFAIVLGLIDNC